MITINTKIKQLEEQIETCKKQLHEEYTRFYSALDYNFIRAKDLTAEQLKERYERYQEQYTEPVYYKILHTRSIIKPIDREYLFKLGEDLSYRYLQNLREASIV